MAYIDLDGRSAKSTVHTGKSGRKHGGGGRSFDDTTGSMLYTPTYDFDDYNGDYKNYTNCYAYALGMQTNPVTGEKFPRGGNQLGAWDKSFLFTQIHHSHIVRNCISTTYP